MTGVERKSSEIRRLVLAKKLYLRGRNHASAKDEVSRMLAIHHFDNVVEIVLKCVATKFGVVSSSKQEFKFKDLWNEIVQRGMKLNLKDQMFTLHDLRNLVQHQGEIPSKETVTKYKGYAEDFFKKVCSNIFNVSYEKLHLSQLIENVKLRKKVLKAEIAFEKEEFKRCIQLCDDALISVVFKEANIYHKAGILTGYWGASEELKKVISENYPEKYKQKDFSKLSRELSRAILQLGQAVTSMQFLDEYRMDFLKHRRVIDNLKDLPKKELKVSAENSLDFVTNLILKWQGEGIFEK
ncbi:MAG TPA: hypothetical protein VFF49_05185 [Thermodesulfobacteriota bacterium]|nr:hypothetical protein [Thermodesulfobacteriota bacterium]